MKWLHLLLAIAAVGLGGNLSLAQQAGDQVVAVAPRAELRNTNVPTGTVPRGAILSVERADGDRFWVRRSDRDGTVKGWIARRDVVPLSRALELFDAELKKNPSALNYRIRGAIWAAKDENDKAIVDFNEAIRLNPRDAAAWRERGEAWMEKNEKAKAFADLNEAIRLEPKDAKSYLCRAIVWMSGRRGSESFDPAGFEQAKPDFDTAARLDPQNAAVLCARGLAWLARDEFEKAIDDFNHAITLDPESAEAYKGRGFVWMFQRKYDQAPQTSTRPSAETRKTPIPTTAGAQSG